MYNKEILIGLLLWLMNLIKDVRKSGNWVFFEKIYCFNIDSGRRNIF